MEAINLFLPGYVGLVSACLTASVPEAHIRVFNMGVSGNMVRDLANRWSSAVIALKPDWLSIMIGINDVWRQFDARIMIEEHISLEDFTRTLDTLIRTTQLQLKGLVGKTPYFIEPNRADPRRKMMDEYGSALPELAERYRAILMDTQAVFDRVLDEMPPMALAWDRVHPSLTGHMILARAFLNAGEIPW